MTRRSAVLGILGVVVLGVILGVVWFLLAPRERLEVFSGEAYPEGFQPRGFITDDVTLVGILAVAGLLVTSIALHRYRDRPLAVLVASSVVGLLVSVIAWRVGEFLGRADITSVAATSPDGTILIAPLRMRMPPDLLAWPIVAAGVVTLATAIDWVRDGVRSEPSPHPSA